ncbi:MAG: fibronectin type III domain-containing protein [Bacteroidales bacterium]|nr:fibronectin type III domain-containing protein [Bacteroidales bacterium]
MRTLLSGGYFPISLQHADEIYNGIVVKNARLVITHTSTALLGAPTGLTVVGVTHNSCSIQWTAPAGTITGYYVYYRKAGSLSNYTNVSATTTNKTITGLDSNTAYEFYITAHVTSLNGSIESVSSDKTTFTTAVSPSIAGPASACYEGSAFTLENCPPGTIQWTVTGPFTLNSATANPVTVTKTGSSNSNGILTAKIANQVVAEKTITPCATGITGPASACYEGSTFTLDNAPQGTITWTITGSFTVSGNGAAATVTRTGTDTGYGTLAAKVDGTVVDTKLVFTCSPLSITGPNYITDYMAESYSVNTTFPVYWTVTPVNAPGFQIIYGQNANPAVVSALYGTPVSGSPNGTLTATVTLPDYSTITVSKTIKGVLPITSISAPASITTNNTVSFYASPATSIYYDDYQWSVIPTNSNSYSWHNYGSRLDVTFYNGGSYCITCRFVSSYYTQPYSEQICVSVYNSYNSYGYAAVYPNPASNILNIEIDAEAAVQAKTSEQAVKREPAYDVRLYDGQGNLLRRSTTKGGKVEFNVSNLTGGIYYLHIYDGVNEKPEIRQIVVER